jgi:hypothetical protein
MVHFKGENMEECIEPESNAQPEHILMTHDESTFWANDDTKYIWLPRGKNGFYRKDRGPSLMVSDFICAKIGRLVLPAATWQPTIEAGVIAQQFDTRMAELRSSGDVRLQLLCKLIDGGLKWSGSAKDEFLQHGAAKLLTFLDTPTSGSNPRPLHDLDLYLTPEVDAKNCKISKSMFMVTDWHVIESKKAGKVDKFQLQHKDGTRLDIDQVHAQEKRFKCGTDLGNLYVGASEGVFNYGQFHSPDDVVGPLPELTLENLLTKNGPVDCHVLRREVYPKCRENGSLIPGSDNDSTFRAKLHSRGKHGSKQYKLRRSYPVQAIIKPGANRDGYWQIDDVVEQLDHAIEVFEFAFPGKIAVFGFDHSSNHMAFAADALRASLLKKGDDSTAKDAPVPSRPGWFHVTDAAGQTTRKTQDMNWTNKGKLMRRGAMSLAKERGLVVKRKNKKGKLKDKYMKCELCTRECSREFTGEADTERVDCCLSRMMARQPDFLAQRCRIEELITSRGHKVFFYPKFHCELNFIEMYWGRVKWIVRRDCDYSIAGLLKSVPKALDAVPLALIRKFARLAHRYMDAYRKGMTGRLADFAVKKYHGHRCIPEKWLTEVVNEYNSKFNDANFCDEVRLVAPAAPGHDEMLAASAAIAAAPSAPLAILPVAAALPAAVPQAASAAVAAAPSASPAILPAPAEDDAASAAVAAALAAPSPPAIHPVVVAPPDAAVPAHQRYNKRPMRKRKRKRRMGEDSD